MHAMKFLDVMRSIGSRLLGVALACTMLLAPVLDLAVEIHESMYSAEVSTNAPQREVLDCGSHMPEDSACADSEGLLHHLSHSSHCCGQMLGWMSSVDIALFARSDRLLVPLFTAAPLTGRANPLLRPPIQS